MKRVAVVTGAARGIGAAIASALEGSGWFVVGVDRAWPPGSVAGVGDAVELDVADHEAVERAIGGVEQSHGPVDALVNNAGITRDGLAHKMDPSTQWAPVIAVNLTGAFNLCRAVLPGMRSRGFGRIVGISSMNGLRGQFGQANYAAAKAGLIAMMKSVALENAARGITANCVAPGFIDTEMTRVMPPAVLEAEAAKIPAGRMGKPEDIAQAVRFLLSPEAAFITGQTLSVNGGQLMA